jgi:transcriptional antiterminator RfaH
MSSTWYLIQTKPNAQNVAARNLARQGCDVFLPFLEQTRRTAQQFRTELRPLFPGYLFVGLQAQAPSWRTLNSTHGVSRGVSLDGTYRPVSDALITQLQSQCDAAGVFRAQDSYTPGDVVGIQTGPFASFVAEVVDMAPDQRIWVLIDLLGQKSRIAVDQQDLKRA